MSDKIMIFNPIVSSSIEGYCWNSNGDFGDLILKFKNGGHYRYSNIPAAIYHEFLNAESHGKYFYANIKSKFLTEKLDLDENNYDTYLEWTPEEEEEFLKIIDESSK